MLMWSDYCVLAGLAVLGFLAYRCWVDAGKNPFLKKD